VTAKLLIQPHPIVDETCSCDRLAMLKSQGGDETRTEFTPEEGMLLREFFELLYQINEREKVCHIEP
jgi:hypothetical protein